MISAGSDIHGPEGNDPLCGFNHVRAEDLTEAAILSAIARGRTYLSCGPRLILTGTDRDGAPVQMGDQAEGLGEARVSWTTSGIPLQLRVIGSAGAVSAIDLPTDAGGEVLLTKLPRNFVQAELRDGAGRLYAVTNPIFLG